MNDSATGSEDRNPYAVPQAELQLGAEGGAAGAVQFYAMAPLKVAILSALAFGIYDLVFWWRHWSARRNAGQDVSVFWRTFFSPFFAFDFRSIVRVSLTGRGLAIHPFLSAAPLVYLLASVIDNAVGRVAGENIALVLLGLVLSLVRGAALAMIQQAANQVLEADGYRGPVNRGLTLGSGALGALGTLVWLFTLSGAVFPGK